MKRLLISLAVVVLVLVGLFYAFNTYIYNEKQEGPVNTDPYRGTLSGVVDCLPPKDPGIPTTAECAIALKTDVGEYYALNFELMSQTAPPVEHGARITASGLITPIENLSSDHWQKYDVEGIFSVADSLNIE